MLHRIHSHFTFSLVSAALKAGGISAKLRFPPLVAGTKCKNTGSQIIELSICVTPYAEDIRIVMPSDATGCTTRASQLGVDGKVTHLVLGSHHGSNVDNANDVNWLSGLNPCTMIIPCGIHRGHRHPHASAVLRMLTHTTAQVAEHVVSVWIKNEDVAATKVDLLAVASVRKVDTGPLTEDDETRTQLLISTVAAVYSTVDNQHLRFNVVEKCIFTAMPL
jgi:hypothetical protein